MGSPLQWDDHDCEMIVTKRWPWDDRNTPWPCVIMIMTWLWDDHYSEITMRIWWWSSGNGHQEMTITMRWPWDDRDHDTTMIIRWPLQWDTTVTMRSPWPWDYSDQDMTTVQPWPCGNQGHEITMTVTIIQPQPWNDQDHDKIQELTKR